jgi:diguanylate cyclase (GGDEF)-like protein/PAS domain S-box-containing protein
MEYTGRVIVSLIVLVVSVFWHIKLNTLSMMQIFFTLCYSAVGWWLGMKYDQSKFFNRKLQESEERYRTLFDNSNDVIVLFELTDSGMPGKFLKVNAMASEKLGYREEELLSMSPIDITPQERLSIIDSLMEGLFAKGHITFEGKYLSKTNEEIPFEYNASLIHLSGKDVVLSIARDIKERKKLEKELTESENRYRNLVEHSPYGIAIHQLGVFTYINRAGATMLGAQNQEAFLHRNILDFILLEYHEMVKEQWKTMSETSLPSEAVEGKMKRLDGQIIDIEIAGQPFTSRGEPFVQILFKDITEQKKAQSMMYKMAYTDTLTNLPNRRLLYNYLDSAIQRARNDKHMTAVLFMDLDGFKEVNDQYGHDIGDLLLKEAARRLRDTIRGDDMVSRLGGDEFIIVLEECTKEEASRIAARLITTIRKPYRLQGHEISVTTSAGISFYPNNGDGAEALIQKADKAMYEAKKQGKNMYCYAK